MSAKDYISENFPVLADISEDVFIPCSRSYRNKLSFALRTFDRFVLDRNLTGSIDIHVIRAYMLYRILGDNNDQLCGNGSVSLNSFLCGELNPLVVGLRQRLGPAFEWTPALVRHHPVIRNQIECLRRDYGEDMTRVHAVPIWPGDEARLLSCLSRCTMGLRDRALLRVLLATGARGHSVAQIRVNLHIQAHNGSHGPHLRVMAPACKTPRGDASITIIRGEAYEDVLRWINRRNALFPDLEYLFISQNGTQVSAESITMMLATLSALAGYGRGFFSCHSTRMGFCGRLHAQNLSLDRSSTEVFDQLAASGQWSYGSTAIRQYVDSRIGRYFNDECRLSYQEFCNLDPQELHSLRKLDPAQRRSNSWFGHDPLLLSSLWKEAIPLDPIIPKNQNLLRSRLAANLYENNCGFRTLVQTVCMSQEIDGLVAPLILSFLLEHEWIRTIQDFTTLDNEKIETLRDDLQIGDHGQARARIVHHTINARAVRMHPSATIEDALLTQSRLKKRIRDNRVNLASMDSGHTLNLVYRRREELTNEVANTRSIAEELICYGNMYSNISSISNSSIASPDELYDWPHEEACHIPWLSDDESPSGHVGGAVRLATAAESIATRDLTRNTVARGGPIPICLTSATLVEPSCELIPSTPRRRRQTRTPSTRASSSKTGMTSDYTRFSL